MTSRPHLSIHLSRALAVALAVALAIVIAPGVALAEDGEADTASCGQNGLFELISGDNLCDGHWSFSLYYNQWDRRVQADPVTDDYDPLWTDWRMDVERASLAFGYGLTDRVTLSVMVPYWSFEGEEFNDGLAGAAILNGQLFRGRIDQSGLGDVRVGFKFGLQRTDFYATAIHAYVDAPTGDDDEAIVTGDPGLGVDFAYSNRAGWVFNAGYFDPGDPSTTTEVSEGQGGVLVPNPALGERSDEIHVGLGYAHSASSTVDWITELNGVVYTDSNGERDRADVSSGARIHLGNPEWAFNAALNVDVSDFDDPGLGGLVGITYAPKNRYELSVTTDGSGTGTVTGSEGQLECGPTCSADYRCGGSVTLTARADEGSRFAGWSGDCAGSSESITITLDDDKSCSAEFIKLYDLTVQVMGETHPDGDDKGGGMVKADGESCNDECTWTHDVGTSIDLEAVPAKSSTFGGWSMDCGGDDPSTSVTLDSDKTCVATFVGPPRPCVDEPIAGTYEKCGRYSNKEEWSCDSATWSEMVDGYGRNVAEVPAVQLPTDENEKKTPLCDLVNFLRMCPEFTACIAGRETTDEDHCTAEKRAATVAGFLQAQASYPFFEDLTPERYELAPACDAPDGEGRSVEIFLEK